MKINFIIPSSSCTHILRKKGLDLNVRKTVFNITQTYIIYFAVFLLYIFPIFI